MCNEGFIIMKLKSPTLIMGNSPVKEVYVRDDYAPEVEPAFSRIHPCGIGRWENKNFFPVILSFHSQRYRKKLDIVI